MSATAAAMPARGVTRRRLPLRPVAITALALVAALVLAFACTNLWTSMQQRSLGRRFDAAAASWARLDAVERSALTFAPGEPVARLRIASMGLDAIVVEGATPAIMRRGPGHLAGSATPGEAGIAIITANRIGFGGFFLRLDRLAAGDTIVTDSPFGATTYTVTAVGVVPAERLDLATDSNLRGLMLIGSSRLFGGSDRLVIRAVAGGA